jgi:hypothetical protein
LWVLQQHSNRTAALLDQTIGAAFDQLNTLGTRGALIATFGQLHALSTGGTFVAAFGQLNTLSTGSAFIAALSQLNALCTRRTLITTFYQLNALGTGGAVGAVFGQRGDGLLLDLAVLGFTHQREGGAARGGEYTGGHQA